MQHQDRHQLKVVNVMAISLDGKISEFPEQTDHERLEYGFSNEEDREFVKSAIIAADAVIVGGGTLRASGKFWSLKNHSGRYPTWVTFSNTAQSIDAILSRQPEIPKVLISQNDLKAEKFLPDVEKISYRDANPGQFLLDHLSRKDYIKNIVLFGGGAINRIFYQEGLVDELKITICPFIFATKGAANFIDPSLPSKVRLCLKSSQFSNNHVFLTYTVQKS
jgi:5-amino-6-(5-phosphoribosylamino)uracil reductase